MGVILAIGAVDVAGRVLTLLYLMHHSEVRCATYRTWVLLTAFLNFAFIAYWLLGWTRKRSAAGHVTGDNSAATEQNIQTGECE